MKFHALSLCLAAAVIAGPALAGDRHSSKKVETRSFYRAGTFYPEQYMYLREVIYPDLPTEEAVAEKVTAIIERQSVPAFRYAAFATKNGCSALSFAGGGTTDSYDSTSALAAGAPVISNKDGNVGTNGNLDENGGPGTVVNGTLSTPRGGVGACTDNNVTALTIKGKATVTELHLQR